MSEIETYELKEFIWLNVFGWVRWREEEYPNRDGYKLGEGGDTCLECDMVDPLSPEGAMEVLKKCAEKVNVTICKIGSWWNVVGRDYSKVNQENSQTPKFISADDESFELTICMFAKILHTK